MRRGVATVLQDISPTLDEKALVRAGTGELGLPSKGQMSSNVYATPAFAFSSLPFMPYMPNLSKLSEQNLPSSLLCSHNFRGLHHPQW